MPLQSLGHAVAMWVLRAGLLASAVTISIDIFDLGTSDRSQNIVLWFALLTILVVVQGAWWGWRTRRA